MGLKEKTWWSIYILHLDNRGKKTKHYGNTEEYYTGISEDVGRRLGDHIFGRGQGYIQTYWRDARKTPVFINSLFGTQGEAEFVERSIKNLRKEKKKELIESDRNKLVGYKPLKFIIVRTSEGEKIINLR